MLVEIVIAVLILLVGYALGRLGRLESILKSDNVNMGKNAKQKGLFGSKSTRVKQSEKIEIDERKFVVDVNTDSFQKDFDELGTKTTSKDDISGSVSKLSQLKKK